MDGQPIAVVQLLHLMGGCDRGKSRERVRCRSRGWVAVVQRLRLP